MSVKLGDGFLCWPTLHFGFPFTLFQGNPDIDNTALDIIYDQITDCMVQLFSCTASSHRIVFSLNF
jgi:hypothetical protein